MSLESACHHRNAVAHEELPLCYRTFPYNLGLEAERDCDSCKRQLSCMLETEKKPERNRDPKAACGVKKVSPGLVPEAVLAEVSLAMQEGARKYGAYNWRKTEVDASTYYNAARRHLMLWWEGEDNDLDTGLSHIVKAIASLIVLRDAQISGMTHDDRPPRAPAGWITSMNERAKKEEEDKS